MASPLPALRDPQGRVVLAWGPDELRARMVRGDRLPFDVIVLTAEGIQDPGHRLEANGYRVVRCPYEDSPDLSQARFPIERCAPQVAAAIKEGARALVLCAAGENRSATMTARIRYLLTGEPGASIVASMRAIPRTDVGRDGRPRRTFSNAVFRRWAEGWPAKDVGSAGRLGMYVFGGVALTAAAILAATLWGRFTNKRRRHGSGKRRNA